MTLTQLRYLVAIADCGLCVTLAADKARTTPAVLLKCIKEFEDQLGFYLFMRKERNLESLSPAGQNVLTYARRILLEVGNIRTYAANERGDSAGRLRLVTTHTEACYVLPEAITEIKRQFPQVDVDLQVVDEDDLRRRLELGDTDIALISTSGSEPRGGLAVPLFRWRRVVLVPRTHPLATLSRTPTLLELSNYPLVGYECANQPYSPLRVALAHEGVHLQVALTARDDHLIKTYVRAGLGIGLLAEMAIGRQDADLHVLSAPAVVTENVSWAVIPHGRVQRDYTATLLHSLAPQLDRRSLRLIFDGKLAPNWPQPPSWAERKQPIDATAAVEA